VGRLGLQVAIFEARPAPASDARTLALSHASREGLDELGAWPSGEASPITSIHISQRGGPGRTMIEASAS
jgi:2-octaprenyl-6-methoxyphenol hydroxylase